MHSSFKQINSAPAKPLPSLKRKFLIPFLYLGYYCVAETLTAASGTIITINLLNSPNPDAVTLDLNGHTLEANGSANGIAIAAGSSNVVIKNGYIIGIGNSASAGITIGTSGITTQNIVISDVTMSNFSVEGIRLADVQNISLIRVESLNNNFGFFSSSSTSSPFATQQVRIESSSFNNNAEGLSFSGSDLYVIDSSFNNNSSHGLFTNAGSSNITIINCEANGATDYSTQANGFFINSTLATLIGCTACYNNNDGFKIASQNSIYSGCVAQANGNDGFEITTPNNILLNCTAMLNATFAGFEINGTSQFNLLRGCIALDNTNASGFLTSKTNNLIQECISNNNTNFGFGDSTSPKANQYYSNSACNNFVNSNYSSTITSAPVTSAANAHGVENIDCANSTVDQIAVMASYISCIASRVGC